MQLYQNNAQDLCGKELWDSLGHGTPEVMDAVFTMAGGFGLLGWIEIHTRYVA